MFWSRGVFGGWQRCLKDPLKESYLTDRQIPLVSGREQLHQSLPSSSLTREITRSLGGAGEGPSSVCGRPGRYVFAFLCAIWGWLIVTFPFRERMSCDISASIAEVSFSSKRLMHPVNRLAMPCQEPSNTFRDPLIGIICLLDAHSFA